MSTPQAPTAHDGSSRTPSSTVAEHDVSLFAAYKADLVKINREWEDISKKLTGMCVDASAAHQKRTRRFAWIIIVLGVAAPTIAVSVAFNLVEPTSRFRDLSFVALAVVALYVVIVLIPAFDMAHNVPVLRHVLSPSAIYRDRILESLDDDNAELKGLKFHCLIVDASTRMAYGGILFGLGVLIAVLAHPLGAKVSQTYVVIIVTVLAAAGIALVLPAIAVAFAFTEVVPKAARSYFPGHDAFIAVCDVLIAAPHVVKHPETARFVISRIEAIAVCFEEKIPKALGLRDNLSDRHVLYGFAAIATHIRALKLEVALPQPERSSNRMSDLALVGVNLALGLYDSDFADQPAIPEPASTASKVLSIAKRLVIAAIPGAVLLIVAASIGLPSDLKAPLTTFCISWALASLAVTQPGTKDLVSLTKDLTNTVQPKKADD